MLDKPSLKEFWQKEKRVIVSAQSARFRVIKYLVIVIGSIWLYKERGLKSVGMVLLVLAGLGIIVHFFFRYKTAGWTRSWWLYKAPDFE